MSKDRDGGPAFPKVKLSEAQKHTIQAPKRHFESGKLYCDRDYLTGLTTINALVRKGLLHSAELESEPHYLTDEGKAVSKRLSENPCDTCGKPTHKHEAACLHCGGMKTWARDCIGCGATGQSLFKDPRWPPLAVRECLCRSCFKDATNEVVEQKQSEIGDLNHSLDNASKAREASK